VFLRALPKLLYIALPLFCIDQVVKWLVAHNLPHVGWAHPLYPYGGVGVFKDFLGIQLAIVHATNKGAAWGAMADWQTYLMAARIVIALGLLIYLLFFCRNRVLETPLCLIVAGAFGNIVDFFLYGHVVDMWCFHFWGYAYPIFNVADAVIFIGVLWLLLPRFFRRA